LSKLDKLESNQVSLAGKSTINRLEYCPETILNQENSRPESHYQGKKMILKEPGDLTY